jgi:predicted transcriptional regulator
MTATAYWPEHFRVRAAKLDLSQNQLAILSGVHQSKVSRGLAGLEPLSNETIERLNDALKALEHLVQLVPFPLDLRRVDRVKELLARVKNGDLGTVLVLPESKQTSELLKEIEDLSTR